MAITSPACRRLAVLALGAAFVWPSVAPAQVDRQQVIEERVAGFRDMGSAFKNLADELRAQRPNLAKVRTSTNVIRTYAKAVPRWFPPGSQPERASKGWLDWVCGILPCGRSASGTHGLVSHAKPEIWSEPAKFRQSYGQFNTAVEAMWRTSRTNDVGLMRAEVRRLEATCKGCHTSFREKVE